MSVILQGRTSYWFKCELTFWSSAVAVNHRQWLTSHLVLSSVALHPVPKRSKYFLHCLNLSQQGFTYCKEPAQNEYDAKNSFPVLCSAVIVILFVMRKRYQKDSLASMKNSGEIHEQLVTYDEEGGGEMDTNGYVDEDKKNTLHTLSHHISHFLSSMLTKYQL